MHILDMTCSGQPENLPELPRLGLLPASGRPPPSPPFWGVLLLGHTCTFQMQTNKPRAHTQRCPLLRPHSRLLCTSPKGQPPGHRALWKHSNHLILKLLILPGFCSLPWEQRLLPSVPPPSSGTWPTGVLCRVAPAPRHSVFPSFGELWVVHFLLNISRLLVCGP